MDALSSPPRPPRPKQQPMATESPQGTGNGLSLSTTARWRPRRGAPFKEGRKQDQPAPDAFEFFKAGEGAPHSVDERLGSICPPQFPRVPPTLSEWKPYDPLEPRNRSSPVPPTLSEWEPPDPSEPETLAEEPITQHNHAIRAHVTRVKCASGFPEGDAPPLNLTSRLKSGRWASYPREAPPPRGDGVVLYQPAPDAFEFFKAGEGAPHSVDERLGSICPPQFPRVPPTLSEWKPYDPLEPRNRSSPVPPTLSEWEPPDPSEPETLAEEKCFMHTTTLGGGVDGYAGLPVIVDRFTR
ncbi:vegetative cell wall protein gp1-like [Camponotus floridanus]|uniref:vegetative cell wall protein gp1-like n=1 Tax=Camponotus floridanus TaxID=104421 RepID=UPI000DC6650A|nr:vegetative cell wall protein gp1-like [Camponotus floridanus]